MESLSLLLLYMYVIMMPCGGGNIPPIVLTKAGLIAIVACVLSAILVDKKGFIDRCYQTYHYQINTAGDKRSDGQVQCE